MVDHQGKPVLGGPQVSLLCLLVPDRTGALLRKVARSLRLWGLIRGQRLNRFSSHCQKGFLRTLF